ncbi:MAG: outer membrane protein assembly factor BamA [Alphaproteobacteria bacterium]
MTVRTLALTLVLASSTTHLVWAEALSKIVVEGNTRVEAETIGTYLPYKIGQEFNAAETGNIIRSLYATGLFSNVGVTFEGGTLAVKVTENPLVNRVAFEGNDALDTKRLEEITQLKARAIYAPSKIQADVQALQAAYRSRGLFTTTVKAQLIERDQNRVDVVYVIDEGSKTKISRINFVGNKRFDDADLKGVIATKTSAWWRFMSGGDTYDPARMDVDKDLVRKYYLSKGYADVQVTSAVAELSRDSKDFVLTYTVYEGPKYDFGVADVVLNAEADGLDVAAMKKMVTLKSGELFDAGRVDENGDALIDHLGKNGFAFLDVKPEYKKNEAERTVDVTYNVKPGPRVYVNRINIEGNTRTRDNVIRREMRVAEGDAFNNDKIKRSRDRLTYLGYFKDVDVTRSETDQPDRVDLNVKVEEQSTGEFNVGAGYSTFDGLLATADVKERNFLGKGQEVAVKFALSERQQNYNLSFTEPYFLGQELAAGVDLFNERTNYQSESSYDVASTGGGLRLGFPINEFTKNTVGLSFKETKIENVGTAASQFVKREEGKRSALALSDTWAYDTRDSMMTPTRGTRVALTGTYSGLGSDVNSVKTMLTTSWNKELMDDVVFTAGGRGGAIYDFGEDLPIYDHFQMGNTTLRGFEYGGVGPRDATTKDALGGKYMVGHSLEMTFPLGSALDDLGVNGLVFNDGGIVKSFEGATANVLDADTYRLSAGTGIFWHSPIGPLRIEFAVPLVKAKEDRAQVFNFSVGSRF